MLKKIRYFIISFFIALYKFLFSDFSGRQCRFEPTCSLYTKKAITEHGVIYGFFLSVKRILKCNPFYRKKETYIFDPVPKTEKKYDK